jgi:hypothetical protein
MPSNVEMDEPELMWIFAVNLEVVNIKDLYAWQALLAYDPQTLVLNEFTPGGFVGSKCATEPMNVVKIFL